MGLWTSCKEFWPVRWEFRTSCLEQHDGTVECFGSDGMCQWSGGMLSVVLWKSGVHSRFVTKPGRFWDSHGCEQSLRPFLKQFPSLALCMYSIRVNGLGAYYALGTPWNERSKCNRQVLRGWFVKGLRVKTCLVSFSETGRLNTPQDVVLSKEKSNTKQYRIEQRDDGHVGLDM